MMIARSKIVSCSVLLFPGLLLLTAPVFSEENVSPEFIPGTVRVTAEELIGLVADKTGLVVIDSRIRGDRHQGYIETSVSLPDNETSCHSLQKIIPSKVTPILFYCNGVKCGRSAVAAKIALECGYQTPYWYRGGFEDWLKKSYPYVQD